MGLLPYGFNEAGVGRGECLRGRREGRKEGGREGGRGQWKIAYT